MKSIDTIRLKPQATIKQALLAIDTGAIQIAVVVDEQGKLLGTITDGDIRRGLLAGLGLDSSIESIIFTSPTVATTMQSDQEILEIALERSIHQIPIVDSHGRIQGIKSIDDLVAKNKTNKVVLMVGGLGTRLRPLTDTTPKPMLKVGDKPILQTIVEQFAKYGYTNIIMCVGYKSNIIQDYFGDGSRFGLHIEYVLEDMRMGTAGALSLIDKNKLNEPFFVMNGDLLTNTHFGHMHDFHTSTNSMATMGVREFEYQVPYGVVNVFGGNIASIEEKPTYKFFVSGGMYMLSPEVLEHIPSNEFYDMPTLFQKLISLSKNTSSFAIKDYWLDIGRIEDYNKANEEYTEVFHG